MDEDISEFLERVKKEAHSKVVDGSKPVHDDSFHMGPATAYGIVLNWLFFDQFKGGPKTKPTLKRIK